MRRACDYANSSNRTWVTLNITNNSMMLMAIVLRNIEGAPCVTLRPSSALRFWISEGLSQAQA